jgi:hypothetical protein
VVAVCANAIEARNTHMHLIYMHIGKNGPGL